MRRYLILLFLIFGSTLAFAQKEVQVNWYHYFNGPASGIDIPNDAKLGPSDNLYIAGRSEGVGEQGQDLLILKFSSTGEIVNKIWFARSGSWDEASSIIVDQDENIYVAGRTSEHGGTSKSIIQKYSSDGDSIWSHAFSGVMSDNNGLHMDAEQNLIVGHKSIYQSIDIVKLKSDFGKDTLWAFSRQYEEGVYFELIDLKTDYNGGIYALASEQYDCGSDLYCTNSIILKLNESGELIWEYKVEDERPGKILPDEKGNLFLHTYGTGVLLHKIGQTGELDWTDSLAYRTNDLTAFDQFEGNVVISYWGRVNSDFFYTVEKLSSTGETIWSKRFSYDEYGFSLGSDVHIDAQGNIYTTGYKEGLLLIKFSNDGEILLTAHKKLANGVSADGNWVFTNDKEEVFIGGRSGDPETGNNFFAMKVDEKVQVSIDEYNFSIPKEVILKQNYPNPFNPVTNIEYEVKQRSEVSIKVFNEIGSLVTELVNSVHSPGSYKVQLNAKNLASGVYFYKLSTGSEVQIRKAILIK